jgi:hypothetical protein
MGNLESLPARQDKEGLRDSVGSPRGELRLLFLGSPARFGREEVKEKRGEGKWERCRVSRASWLPRDAWASCPFADSKMARFCPPGV